MSALISSHNYALFKHFSKVYNKTIIEANDIKHFPLATGQFGRVSLCYDDSLDTIFIRKVLAPTSKHKIKYNELAYIVYLKDYCQQYVICMRQIIIQPLPDEMAQVVIDMEFLGFALESYMRDNMAVVSPIDMGIIMRRLVKGLNYMHSIGICHRDIKPANIVINPNTLEVKYIDFGESCMSNVTALNLILIENFGLNRHVLSEDDNQKCFTKVSGTPMFSAPEVFMNSNNMFEDIIRCDIWSLGVVFYWLLFQKNLFNVNNIAALMYSMEMFTTGTLKETINKDMHTLFKGVIPTGYTGSFYLWAIKLIMSMLDKNPLTRADGTALEQAVGIGLWNTFELGQNIVPYSEKLLDDSIQEHINERGKPPVAQQTKIIITNETGLSATIHS